MHISHIPYRYLFFTQIDEEHRSMTGVIGQSKKLITKYMRREFTDKVCILKNILSLGVCTNFKVLREFSFEMKKNSGGDPDSFGAGGSFQFLNHFSESVAGPGHFNSR
jgi:hypothetical protein